MTVRPDPTLVPELLVRDIDASRAFWCDLCGFDVAYDRPDEGFAYLTHGTSHLMLDTVGRGRDFVTADLAYPFGRGMNLQISVADADRIAERLAKAGVAFVFDPESKTYDTDGGPVDVRQFVVADPDGYLVRFQSRRS